MFDYTQERDNLVPAGTYEATAACGGVMPNKFGEDIISLSWKIREDVEQPCQGRIVFDDIRKDKNDPNEFNQQKIYEIVHGGQDHSDANAKFTFESYDEICQYLNGVCMKIDVDVRTSNSGKKYNCIKFGGYHPSGAKGQSLGSPTGVIGKGNLDSIDVTDDDLPF